MSLSIIIPTLNEAACLRQALLALQTWRQQGIEVIVVDGGSTDKTVAATTHLVDQLLLTAPGRARQMNAGAEKARGDYLLFVHADTQLPDGLPTCPHVWMDQNVQWGFFSVQLSGKKVLLRLIEWAMNWRSRVTGIGTGDQCLFIRRALFEAQRGFPDLPLMEDVALCKQLRRRVWPRIEPYCVITSSRRWERDGIVSTVWLMWKLRLAYFFGVSPSKLVSIYYPTGRQ